MTQTEASRTQVKRAQMLDAARTLFLAQGYARTSTDAIAKEAGVSKQTLYVYFPGKAELLAAVVAREVDGLTARGEAAGLPTTLPEVRARLLAFAHAVTRQLLHPDALALLRLLLGEAAHLPELRGPLREAVPNRLLSSVEAMLCAAHDARLIHVPDLALCARMFVGPVMSFVVLDGFFGDTLPELPTEVTLGRVVDLFLKTVEVEA